MFIGLVYENELIRDRYDYNVNNLLILFAWFLF